LWAVSVAAALAPAFLLARSLENSIGSSRVHERLRSGFDMGWFGEYEQRAEGLERTFHPSLAGAGAFYDNLEAWLTGGMFDSPLGVLFAGALYAVLWAALSGGILGRFARPAGRGLRAFSRDAGRYAFRFVRLAGLSAIGYYSAYTLARWLFGRLEDWTREVTAELPVFALSVLVWISTLLLLSIVHTSFNYAKIATVVEERRSMVLAALRGLALFARRPGSTLGLYYALLLVGAAALALYALLAPGIGQTTFFAIGLAWAAGQVAVLVQLALKLSLLAGQVSLYGAISSAERGASTREFPGLGGDGRGRPS
jgi:hypothetical protein